MHGQSSVPFSRAAVSRSVMYLSVLWPLIEIATHGPLIWNLLHGLLSWMRRLTRLAAAHSTHPLIASVDHVVSSVSLVEIGVFSAPQSERVVADF